MSIDIVSLFLDYAILPFCLSLIITILISQIYDKLRDKNKGKHHYLELKIFDLDKQLREQREKTNLLADIIVSRTNQTNSKLDNIQSLIKTLDENILFETPPEKLPVSKKKKLNTRKVGGEF